MKSLKKLYLGTEGVKDSHKKIKSIMHNFHEMNKLNT